MDSKSYPLHTKDFFLIFGFSSIFFTFAREADLSYLLSISISIMAFAIISVGWTYYALLVSKRDRFRIKRDINFRHVIDDVKEAKEKIYATHFSQIIPTEDYSKVFEEILNTEKVSVTRIIPSDIKNDDWLNGCRKHESYTEIKINQNLHFDILIIDKTKVRLFFPSTKDTTHYSKVVYFDNEDIALIFSTYFDRLSSYKE